MPISDISKSSPGVHVSKFVTGTGSFSVTTDQIVRSLNELRDSFLSAAWRVNRGLVGTGSINYPLAIPDEFTPIVPNVNEYITTIASTPLQATVQEAAMGPYNIAHGSN